MKTEKEITRSIVKHLRACGCFVFKHWGGPMSKRGVSDLLGCLPDGRMLAVEVKRLGGKASEEQKAFIADVGRCGGLAFIADSVDAVKSRLDAVGVAPRQMDLFR
jgi:hypothetical protein